jgi:hypothetical protein
MRKKVKPSPDTPLPMEDSAMADPKITPDVEQPSLFPELPADDPVVASGGEVKPPKKAKPKPVITHDLLPPENPMEVDVDEFSPENLRLLNKIDLKDLVTAELVELPARKPKKDEWFRVHPDYRQQGGILEIDSENKVFWVSKKMQSQVAHDPCFTFRLCVLVVTRQGVPFIWPVKTDVEAGGTGDKYVRIPFAAMTYGREKWTRLYWSNERREHQVETSELLDAPKFPDKPFAELLKLAFKDAVISTVDHPAILNLKGKAK